MKMLLLSIFVVCAVLPLPLRSETGEEARLIAVIQSSASPAEKEDACRQIKRIGTTNSVAALSSLLTDEHLYQAACDALETMPFKAAEAALLSALGITEGKTKAGIIHAIGEHRLERGEPRNRSTVSLLAPLLKDTDPLIASAAARALGQVGEINGREAANALLATVKTATEPTRSAEVDALLHWEQADWEMVMKISQQFGDLNENENVRIAAFRSLLGATLAGGYPGTYEISNALVLKLVVEGIEGDDNARLIEALRFARDVILSGISLNVKAVPAFTNLFPKTSPAKQAALISLLQESRAVAAAPAVLELAGSKDSYVRATALAALGTLGDASVVPQLARAAASSNELDQNAARRALIELRRGDVGGALVAQLKGATPAVQAELARALGARFEKSAVGQLLELARSDSGPTRKAAFRALSQLADGSHFTGLVKLMEVADTDPMREEIRGVFESVVDRADPKQKFNVAPIVSGLNTTNVATRIALLRVSSLFSEGKLRTALRDALKDNNESIRTAAARALCDSRDAGVLKDLEELARTSRDSTLRVLALEGYVRLVREDAGGFVVQKRAQLLNTAFALATRVEDKRLVLSALPSAPHLTTLELARGSSGQADVRPESEIAATQIARGLLTTEPTAAKSALHKLATGGGSENIRTNALRFLKHHDSGWLCAGPYREEGKKYKQLFNIPFAPELSGAEGIVWRIAPGSPDLSRPGEIDLTSVAGASHSVVYVKTRVYSPTNQNVTMMLGSDDGLKLWLNGDLIHSTNVGRWLVPAQDQVTGRLRAGWNDLFAKVTQNGALCGMSLQFKDTIGDEVNGLRLDPHGGEQIKEFKRVQLSEKFFAEGATVADLNRDGKLDVIAGPYWFEGPDFTQRNEYRSTNDFDPHGYSDNFLTYTADFNADGWVDIFCVPFPGADGFWYANPAGKSEAWAKHLAYPMVGNESPGFVDVDGDARPDLIFNNDGFIGYATFDPAKPDAQWNFHAVTPQDKRFQRFTHGIGAGDINGDGRMDLVETAGWWEQPKDLKVAVPWTFHPQQFAEAASQMLVTDVDGDGRNDVICSWHCHLYGLMWYRQTHAEDGSIGWQQNVILSSKPDTRVAGLRFSQLHAMTLADMNGDGLPDIVTGKRFWAHGPTGDVEPDAPAVLYWFELKRGPDKKVRFIPHLIDDNSGVGTQVIAADLNGDNRPDVIVANKKGIFLHLNFGINY